MNDQPTNREDTDREPPHPIVRRFDQIAPSVWIAPDAVVIGDVSIGRGSGIWFKAILRGDSDPIRVGDQTNIQDGSILHSDPGFPCQIGDRVTVGHAAIVHGATVESECLIGMRATLLNGVVIGRGSIVAAGALVTENTIVPPGSIVMGSPAKVRGEANAKHADMIRRGWTHYAELAERYRRPIDESGSR